MFSVYLQETQDVVGLRLVTTDDRRLADSCRKGRPLTQRTVLHSGGKEGRGVHLLPQVKAVFDRTRQTQIGYCIQSRSLR